MERDELPDKKDVERHWKAQTPSVFRPPRSRDPGLSITNTPGQTRAVLEAEMAGEPVELCRNRSPATTYHDPIAQAQSLIRWFHAEQPADEEFQARVTCLEDHMLYLLLCGNMSDNQRVQGLVKLSKLLTQAQHRQEDLLHRERKVELEREKNLLRAGELQSQMVRQKALKAKVEELKSQARDIEAGD